MVYKLFFHVTIVEQRGGSIIAYGITSTEMLLGPTGRALLKIALSQQVV